MIKASTSQMARVLLASCCLCPCLLAIQTTQLAAQETTGAPANSAPNSSPSDDAKPKTGKASTKIDPQRVLASVGQTKITLADVDLALGRTASVRGDLPPIPEPILMSSVDIIAQRKRALESLKKAKKRVSDEAIDKWLVSNSPPELKWTAAQALAARADAAHVSPDNYREFLAFRLSWQAYVESNLSEKNLEKHFKNQKTRFDGTRFEVEHLYVPTPPGASPAREQAHERLQKLRPELADGKLTFAQAALRLLPDDADQSTKDAATQAAAPVSITGSGPLMPRIVDQVLKTPSGKLSEPFDSASAVHLVRVVKVEAGNRSLSDAQDDVRRHMLAYLLEFMAEKSAEQMPLVWLDNSANATR